MDITARITAALAPARIRGDHLTVDLDTGAVVIEWSGPRIRHRRGDRTLIQRTRRHAEAFAAAVRDALAAEGLPVAYTHADSREAYGDRTQFGVVAVETAPLH